MGLMTLRAALWGVVDDKMFLCSIYKTSASSGYSLMQQ